MRMPLPATIIHSNTWPCTDLDLDPLPSKCKHFFCHFNYTIEILFVRYHANRMHAQTHTHGHTHGQTTQKHNTSTAPVGGINKNKFRWEKQRNYHKKKQNETMPWLWTSINILCNIHTLSGFFLSFFENIRSLNLCNRKKERQTHCTPQTFWPLSDVNGQINLL